MIKINGMTEHPIEESKVYSLIGIDEQNIEVGSTVPAGILVDGEQDIIIRDCSISYNACGIKIVNSYNITVQDCVFSQCGTGVYIKNSEYCSIIDNRFYSSVQWAGHGNGGCAVLAEGGYNHNIESNSIEDSEEHGIYLSGTEYCMVAGNRCLVSGENGIQLNKGSDPDNPHVRYNIISNNICSENGHYGIALFRYAYYNSVNGNICCRNTRGTIKQSYGDNYFPREEWSKGNRLYGNVKVS